MNRDAGFSIPDIIMGMTIIAVAVVGIMGVQRNYVEQVNRTIIQTRAISLGNAVMSTIRMHRYDENASEPWSSSLGADSETMANYDDIDDYAYTSWDFSSLGYVGFDVLTKVWYVDTGTSWLDSVAGPTDFKRITVIVDHDILSDPIVFYSLAGGGY